MQAVQKSACQGVSRSIWLPNVSLLNLTLGDGNKGLILPPCPSLIPPSDPFSASSFSFQALTSSYALPPSDVKKEKKGEMCNMQKNQELLTSLLISAMTHPQPHTQGISFIAHYKTISPNRGGAVLCAANKRTFSLEICECNLQAPCPPAHTHR